MLGYRCHKVALVCGENLSKWGSLENLCFHALRLVTLRQPMSCHNFQNFALFYAHNYNIILANLYIWMLCYPFFFSFRCSTRFSWICVGLCWPLISSTITYVILSLFSLSCASTEWRGVTIDQYASWWVSVCVLWGCVGEGVGVCAYSIILLCVSVFLWTVCECVTMLSHFI